MKYSLKAKLSLSYVLFTVLIALLLIFFTNFVMENQFRDYVMRQQTQRNQEVVSLVGQQYFNGQWNSSVIENIGVGALGQGIILKLYDNNGKTVWDATIHNNGMCSTMISQMAATMSNRYPNFKGGYVEDTYPIMKDQVKAGTAVIGYYGPYYYTSNDLYFINTLNKVLAGIGLFTVIAALLLGSFMSKRLSSPITMAINTAGKIAKGDYSDRISVKSSTKEIIQLTSAINSLAETLGSQEKLRKRLTGDVAHELRTPMATLQSHIEAMIDGVWVADEKRLTSCHEEILRLNRMVGNLEKLAKYESENLMLNKEEFNIYELIETTMRNFETEARNKNIEIYLDGEEVLINADKDKISQVLVNLISNALKYTSQGGTIKINVSETENSVLFSVSDSGNGIPDEDLPHIFERFYRADKSRNRETGGSGIGLTIVRSIIDAHKGDISVTSVIDKGTEFKIILPK